MTTGCTIKHFTLSSKGMFSFWALWVWEKKAYALSGSIISNCKIECISRHSFRIQALKHQIFEFKKTQQLVWGNLRLFYSYNETTF